MSDESLFSSFFAVNTSLRVWLMRVVVSLVIAGAIHQMLVWMDAKGYTPQRRQQRQALATDDANGNLNDLILQEEEEKVVESDGNYKRDEREEIAQKRLLALSKKTDADRGELMKDYKEADNIAALAASSTAETKPDPSQTKGSQVNETEEQESSTKSAPRAAPATVFDVDSPAEPLQGKEMKGDNDDKNKEVSVDDATEKHVSLVTSEGQDEVQGDESASAPVPAPAPASSPPPEPETIRFTNVSSDHPGLQAFWYWCDTQASLYRAYTVSRYKKPSSLNHDDDDDPTAYELVVPPSPYVPTSRHGWVKVHMTVTNRTNTAISVYWVDHLGKDVFKGTLSANGGTWNQWTWMEHAWIFCQDKNQEGDHAAPISLGDRRILLQYMPFAVIPNTRAAPTLDQDGKTGVHKFDILPHRSWAIRDDTEIPCCRIEDAVLPFPAEEHLTTQDKAIEWSLVHCERLNYNAWNVLLQYLRNTLLHPGNPKYRRIRIANSKFFHAVWQTPARGLLLAVGFVEQGAFAELGTASKLPRQRVQDMSRLVMSIEKHIRLERLEGGPEQRQPEGADGSGRANWNTR